MSLSARAIAVGGLGFGAALTAVNGFADLIQQIQPPIIKRRSGLGSLKITPRVLPTYNPELEEIFEPETTLTEKTIRAKSKRDEFLILH